MLSASHGGDPIKRHRLAILLSSFGFTHFVDMLSKPNNHQADEYKYHALCKGHFLELIFSCLTNLISSALT